MSTTGWSVIGEWMRWKRLNETLRLAVVADVTSASGISEPELTVLVHLHNAAGGLRQSALAEGIGWDRTRLSHLLTRMESRALLGREKLANGVEVTLRPAGRELIDALHPQLEAAVRRHLLDKLSAEDRRALERIVERLLD